MGLLLGLLLGVGLLLVTTSGRALTPRPAPRRRRTERMLEQAGIRTVTARQLQLISGAAGVGAAFVVLVLTGTYPLAVAFGVFAALLPFQLVGRRRAARLRLLRSLWPEVVDNLASAVRAGLSLPEALTAVGERGPMQLRPPFTRFGEDYQATGSFGPCLARLAGELADPVADRIVETLRIAREVGGTDLGRVLRTLSQFLREDGRVRAELESRQSWTLNAARLAVAAPWAVLVLLCLNGATVTAYNTPTGVAILTVGGLASCLAYQLMRRIGRLPEEPRVARGAGTGTSSGTGVGVATSGVRL
ncbi:MAG: type II secretion system F family protein [Frankiaceae bacterium]